MAEKAEAVEQAIEIPSLYFNGFQIGITNSDVSGILLLNNQPQLLINMSYTTAKTFHQALGSVIAGLERVTAHEIMTTKEIDKGMAELAKPKAEA